MSLNKSDEEVFNFLCGILNEVLPDEGLDNKTTVDKEVYALRIREKFRQACVSKAHLLKMADTQLSTEEESATFELREAFKLVKKFVQEFRVPQTKFETMMQVAAGGIVLEHINKAEEILASNGYVRIVKKGQQQ